MNTGNNLVVFAGGCMGAAYSMVSGAEFPTTDSQFLPYVIYALLGGFLSLVGKRLAEYTWTVFIRLFSKSKDK